MRYLIFDLGNKTLALPAERVLEVVRLLLLGPSPGRVYIGSIQWRGKTLAILSPETLGVKGPTPAFVIVTEVMGTRVGFPADRATSMIETEEIAQAPPGSDEWLVGLIGEQGAWAIDPDRVITIRDAGEAAALAGERDFLEFCAKTLAGMAKKRKSRELERAAGAIEKELGKK